MSEFFIQEKQLSRATRTVVKNEAGKSLFLMVGRWGTKGDALSLLSNERKSCRSYQTNQALLLGIGLKSIKSLKKLVRCKKFLIGRVIFITFAACIGLYKEIFTTISMKSIILISES